MVVKELEDLKLLTLEELRDSGLDLGKDIIDPLLAGSSLYEILGDIIEVEEPEPEPKLGLIPEPIQEPDPEPIPEPEPEEEIIPEEEVEEEPEPELVSDNGEPLYEYDDFIGTAIEFYKHFDLANGSHVYYGDQREAGYSDEEIHHMFSKIQFFDITTCLYQMSIFFKIPLNELLEKYNEDSVQCVFDIFSFDKARAYVQAGIDVNTKNQLFNIPLICYFSYGYLGGLFEICGPEKIKFKSQEAIETFFGSKKFLNYFNLVDLEIDKYLLWSNKTKVLDIRDYFDKIISYCLAIEELNKEEKNEED